MAGYANKMSILLDKIERRLGTKPLKLPEDVKKDKWAEIIKNETLDTFSRYFPYCFKYEFGPEDKIGEYYYIDEEYLDGATILGIRDISWPDFAIDSIHNQQNSGYGLYDFLGANYGMDDVALIQMRADHMSLFNNGIYPVFDPPNRFQLLSATNTDIGALSKRFHMDILLKHPDHLTTISPTKMETFEALATADVATFLYRYLKYYDQLQTVYVNIDLKLQDIEQEASKREEVIQQLKDGYVSAANDHQPIMWTV